MTESVDSDSDRITSAQIEEKINEAKELEQILKNEGKMPDKKKFQKHQHHGLPTWVKFLYVLTFLIAVAAFVVRIKSLV
ncbi:hypothetical protein TVAG_304580 [Trichomonas vaginalis G3]|uniref:Uncharacterized protein n=1 Tax=Trichomonas vaginalis (strain ATCC PRA-98 / G3) TaxID=412133 RepID=A2F2P3_TRIV3|nr:hypothetical protein TVAGG3_1020540 [Trichomonas vaginalis G3]EAY00817.1 hypothetical protein TVAG_304580 [Trichomonas vaginalis G3]KAI5492103.1 hypothetical protein TVAGG3_1020540 [Trichomonas vaginalis G3]|eukprot:XP_001313746.1 hypothetical protein [Trichomonas vaginalis G3]